MPICVDTDNVFWDDPVYVPTPRKTPAVRHFVSDTESPYAVFIPTGLPATKLAFDTPRVRPWPTPRRTIGESADVTQVIPPQDLLTSLSSAWSLLPVVSQPTMIPRRLPNLGEPILPLLLVDYVSQLEFDVASPPARFPRPAFVAAPTAEVPVYLVQFEVWVEALQPLPLVRWRGAAFTPSTGARVEAWPIADDRQTIGGYRFDTYCRWPAPAFRPSVGVDPPLAWTLDVGRYTAALDAAPAGIFHPEKAKPCGSPDDTTAVYQGVVDTAAIVVGRYSPALAAAPALRWPAPALTPTRATAEPAAVPALVNDGWTAAFQDFPLPRYSFLRTASWTATTGTEPPWTGVGIILVAGPYWVDCGAIYVAGAEVGGVRTG